MFAVGLLYMAFLMLRYVSSMSAFWRVFIINGVEFSLGLGCCVWAFSSCSERGLHSSCAWASHCCGFSCGTQALEHVGFRSCGSQAQ